MDCDPHGCRLKELRFHTRRWHRMMDVLLFFHGSLLGPTLRETRRQNRPCPPPCCGCPQAYSPETFSPRICPFLTQQTSSVPLADGRTHLLRGALAQAQQMSAAALKIFQAWVGSLERGLGTATEEFNWWFPLQGRTTQNTAKGPVFWALPA